MEHRNDHRDSDLGRPRDPGGGPHHRPPAADRDGAGSGDPGLGRRAADLAGAGVLVLSVYALALLGHGAGFSP